MANSQSDNLLRSNLSVCWGFCQPIKYVLFGFARRTGLLGPIGRRQFLTQMLRETNNSLTSSPMLSLNPHLRISKFILRPATAITLAFFSLKDFVSCIRPLGTTLPVAWPLGSRTLRHEWLRALMPRPTQLCFMAREISHVHGT